MGKVHEHGACDASATQCAEAAHGAACARGTAAAVSSLAQQAGRAEERFCGQSEGPPAAAAARSAATTAGRGPRLADAARRGHADIVQVSHFAERSSSQESGPARRAPEDGGALDASDGAVARPAKTAAEAGHEPVLAALREEQARRETMLSEVSA